MSLTDNSIKEVMGSERVELNMTSNKVLIFQGVLHVLTLQGNLIIESHLFRTRYRIVKESNKFVIFKNKVFIGKGLVSDGIFRFNVINHSDNKILVPVALNIESCDV